MNTTIDRLREAVRCHQTGEIERAEGLYREILRLDPAHPDALHLLGVAELQRGETDSAIGRINRAIALRPDYDVYHANLAAAYRAARRNESAERSLRRALEINPTSDETCLNLGNVLREMGDTEQALQFYRRALTINPELEDAREAVEQLSPETGTIHPQAEASADNTIRPPADNLSAPAQPTVRTVLHVGCGPDSAANLHERFRRPDWKEVRLDIDPDVRPDIVASLTDMSAVESGSVDAVWSSHNLEHLAAHEVPCALAEFRRVLKPKGFALITLPDLQQIAEYIIADRLEETAYESPAGPVTPRDMLFGMGGWIAEGKQYMAHRTGFTATTLERHLRAAGFNNVKTWFAPFTLWAEASC